MDDQHSDTFVFLLHSDGTFAWVNTNPWSGEEIVGQNAWIHCDPKDQNRIRDGLVKLMFDSDNYHATIRSIDGYRFAASMQPLPVLQPAHHAVIGWCRRLCDDVETLSTREREVLLLICDELTTEKIAQRLHISPATVETHRQNIGAKLNTKSVVGQVRATIRGGLIDP